MKTIAVYNQKGGCGKTLTTFNLAGVLAEQGYRVLVMDTDGQASITLRLLKNTEIQLEELFTLTDVMCGQCEIAEAIIKPNIPLKNKDVDISLLPADNEVNMVSKEFSKAGADSEMFNAFKMIVEEVAESYDFCLIDCPPALGTYSRALLNAAEYVLCPVISDMSALQGYQSMIDTINDVRMNYNSELKFLGIFVTNATRRKGGYDQEFINGVKQIGTYIPITIHATTIVKHADSHGIPVCLYKPKIAISEEYRELSRYILNRTKVK